MEVSGLRPSVWIEIPTAMCSQMCSRTYPDGTSSLCPETRIYPWSLLSPIPLTCARLQGQQSMSPTIRANVLGDGQPGCRSTTTSSFWIERAALVGQEVCREPNADRKCLTLATLPTFYIVTPKGRPDTG